jgi:hypothetical protein
MSRPESTHERALRKLLNSHVEEGVPSDHDLWSKIDRRLDAPSAVSQKAEAPTWVSAASTHEGVRPSRFGNAFRMAFGLAGFALLLAITTFSISRLAQRGDNPSSQFPTPDANATDGPLSDTLLFTIPVGVDGLRLNETGVYKPGGFAIADDGTFWIADGENRILQYSRQGEPLRVIAPFPNVNRIHSLATSKSDLLILAATAQQRVVHRVGIDGRVITTYPLPDFITSVDGIITGTEGEVLLISDFYNPYYSGAGLSTSFHPNPTNEALEGYFTSFWQIADANGEFDPEPWEGYKRGGHVYTALVDRKSQDSIPTGYVAVDGKRTPVTVRYTLTGLRVLAANADGSFYVLVEERDEAVTPAAGAKPNYRTLLHFDISGRLMRHTQLSTPDQDVQVGPDGQVYSAVARRSDPGAVPDRVEIIQLGFYDASEPLLPPAISTPDTVGPTPAPTSPAPPLPVPSGEVYNTPVPPPPAPTPVWDLRSLAFNATIIAEAHIIGSETRPHMYTIIFYVDEWYKNDYGSGNTLRLAFDTRKNWDRLVYLLRNLIGSQQASGSHRFMLFLTGAGGGDLFITGDTAGVFYLRNEYGGIVEAGDDTPQYQGMSIQRFKEELRAVLPATPTPAPPTSTPLPTPADGRPVSLIRQGDGYKVYVHRGVVRLVPHGSDGWIEPDQLRFDWSTAREPYTGTQYIANLKIGTVEIYTYPKWMGMGVYGNFPSPAKKHILLLDGATEDVWGASLYDVDRDERVVVFDRKPETPQWANPEVHGQERALSPGSPTWLDEKQFLLPISYFPSEMGPADGNWGRGAILLLGNVDTRQLRVIAREANVHMAARGKPLLYQTGGLSGPLYMLLPPYTGNAVTITAGGPWIRDVSATPDGRHVAWVESTPPPGDWSHTRLPSTCVSCGSGVPKDPEPENTTIAIWDASTGQPIRHKVSGLVWSLGTAAFYNPYSSTARRSLTWGADGNTLYHATHAPGNSSLHSITPGGKPTLLASHPWDGAIHFLGETGDGALLYMANGRKYFAAGDVVRRRPDGRLEVLHTDLSHNMLWLEEGKWLEVLGGEGEVLVFDLGTGTERKARFGSLSPNPGELGWASVRDLVSISPDGKWAAYAGSNSDAVIMSPNGASDRGREVLIVPLK